MTLKIPSLERVIRAVGGEPVAYAGRTKCCGFPIILEKEAIAVAMAGTHMNEAKDQGADFMVTPCPLCHMSLDIYQERAGRAVKPLSTCRFCICRNYLVWRWDFRAGSGTLAAPHFRRQHRHTSSTTRALTATFPCGADDMKVIALSDFQQFSARRR